MFLEWVQEWEEKYSWSFTGINVLKHSAILVECWNCIYSWLQDPGSPAGSRNTLFSFQMELWHNKELLLMFVLLWMLSGKKTFTDLLNSIYLIWTSISVTRSSLKLLITEPTCACWAWLLGIICVTPDSTVVLYFKNNNFSLKNDFQ